MLLNRSRSLSASFTYKKAKFSTKSEKTHYDTLGVKSTATQSEIKTAYFELTKKYHPDINNSELAKARFRNVSDAYEVLRNSDSRKYYDQMVPSERDSTTGINQNFSDTYSTKSRTSARNSDMYHFDEWTSMRYKRAVKRKHFKNQINELDEEYRRAVEKHKKESKDATPIGLFLIIVIVIYIAVK